jgi:hypothetical protein
MAGCAGEPPTDGERSIADDLLPGAVRFSLAKGPQIPIRVVLPEIATVDVVVKDHAGANVLAVTQVAYPRWPYSYFYGLCGDDCAQLPRGSYAKLPEGDYTVEAVETAPHGRRLSCTFVPAAATHRIALFGNLDTTARTTLFDASSPETTSDFLTSVEISDSLGYRIPLDIFFGKLPGTAATCDGGEWTYHVLTDGADLAVEGDGKTPARAGWSTEVARGRLCFGLQGELVAETPSDELSFIPRHASEPQSLRFSFGAPGDTAGDRIGFTQRPAMSYVLVADADGTAPFVDCTVGEQTPPVVGEAAVASPLTQTSASPRTVIDVRPIDPGPYEYSLRPQPSAEACVCGELGTSGADIPSQVFPPGKSPTSSIHLRGNLEQTAVATAPFDPAAAEATASFATTVTVNDPLGNAVDLRLYFSKLDAKSTQAGDSGDWTYHVLMGSGAAPRTVVAAGQLRFDDSGRLISNDTTVNSTVDFCLEAITFDFGTGTASGGSGLDGLTQYAALSEIWQTELVGAYPESCRVFGVDPTAFLCWKVAWPE